MKNLLLIITILTVICVPVSAQKLTEPILLGTWLAGEDPSEFIYHKVLEASLVYVKENPKGKILIRICSSDEFSTAFVKTSLSPLYITTYGFYDLLTTERFSVARFSKCLRDNKFNSSEYWFIPEGKNIEYEEIYPIKNISYKEYEIFEFEETTARLLKEEFEKNLSSFIKGLKNNPKSNGFIIHNSKKTKMKQNIEKVLNAVKMEGIDIGRVKSIIKPELDVNKKGKLYLIKDNKKSLPVLAVMEIKN